MYQILAYILPKSFDWIEQSKREAEMSAVKLMLIKMNF